MRRAIGFGIILWNAFAIFDWHVGRYIGDYDRASLLAIRFGLAPVHLGVLWRLLRTPVVRARELQLLDLLVFPITAAALGWMASVVGLIYPYPQGVYIVLMTRGAFLMQPWWQSWAPSLAVVVANVAAFSIGASFRPWLAPQVDSALGGLIALGTHVSLLFAAAMMVMASHTAWVLRRRVFQARQLGQYKLDVPIGEGGHGQVWRAFHNGLNVFVAIKILKGEWRLDSPQVLRFQREARATFALKHPNTVRMLDYGVTVDGVCYLAMELLEGRTLAQVVEREGPLDPARALHVVLQAANALAEAHAHGMVHRDVKPENLLITRVGQDA
ncbi:MAG TPA: serine/threonine-protein kinase, partial [Polyangiales bacterium]